ncbi:MAG: glycosyltransferase family A protein [Hyphomicrobiales bacterium]
MNEISVSVIIPAYNASQTIERTVRSVTRQTIPPDEIIIVDDASDDFESLKAIIEDIDCAENTNFLIHRNEKNLNGAVSRNCGIEMASGEYVAFLDADDEWEPEKLELSMQALASTMDNAIVYSKVQVMQDETRIGERPARGLMDGEHVSEYLFLSGGFIQTSTIVCSRKLASQIRFNPQFRRHQDYDFCLRAAHSGARFIYVDKPIVRYQSSSGLFSDRAEASEYSIWWSRIMRPYMSYFGYHGFMLFAVSARLASQGAYGRTLANAFYQSVLIGPIGLWKARSKIQRIVSQVLNRGGRI